MFCDLVIISFFFEVVGIMLIKVLNINWGLGILVDSYVCKRFCCDIYFVFVKVWDKFEVELIFLKVIGVEFWVLCYIVVGVSEDGN